MIHQQVTTVAKKTAKIRTLQLIDLTAFADAHVSYEAEMFVFACQFLANLRQPSREFNVFFESTLIHCRNLVDFFYPPVRCKADEVIAADYATDWEGARPEIPSVLEKARARANKQLAHLSVGRENTAKFNFVALSAGLREVVSVFLTCVDPLKLGPKAESELRRI